MIQPPEYDYTHGARSTAVSNCSNRTIAQVTHWLGQCIASHTQCFDVQTVAATRDFLPKRLLDLRFVAQEGHVRLMTSHSPAVRHDLCHLESLLGWSV